jgi:hypothetical protein
LKVMIAMLAPDDGSHGANGASSSMVTWPEATTGGWIGIGMPAPLVTVMSPAPKHGKKQQGFCPLLDGVVSTSSISYAGAPPVFSMAIAKVTQSSASTPLRSRLMKLARVLLVIGKGETGTGVQLLGDGAVVGVGAEPGVKNPEPGS